MLGVLAAGDADRVTRAVERFRIDFARKAGQGRMRLWTESARGRAAHLPARGFRLVREESHHSFGTDMAGQYYELDLQ